MYKIHHDFLNITYYFYAFKINDGKYYKYYIYLVDKDEEFIVNENNSLQQKLLDNKNIIINKKINNSTIQNTIKNVFPN